MDIYEYLSNRNIIVNDEKFREKSASNNISEQVQLITDVHSKLLGGKEVVIPRIQSVIGKEIASYKVEVRKNKNYLNKIEMEKNISDFQAYLLSESKKIIEEAESVINMLDSDIYFKLIKRSMKRYEICLGRVDEGNLKKDKNDIIYIRTSKYIAYNLLEHDCYNYIKKLKKKKSKNNIENIIIDFVNKSSLGEESIRYLNILASYPIESMKLLSKYRSNELNTTNEGIEKKLEIAKEIDRIELYER